MGPESDHCGKCGKLVGRAGRTNEQIIETYDRGEFTSAIRTKKETFCPVCFRASRKKKS